MQKRIACDKNTITLATSDEVERIGNCCFNRSSCNAIDVDFLLADREEEIAGLMLKSTFLSIGHETIFLYYV